LRITIEVVVPIRKPRAIDGRKYFG